VKRIDVSKGNRTTGSMTTQIGARTRLSERMSQALERKMKSGLLQFCAALLVTWFGSGCYSIHTPPPLSSAETARLANHTFPRLTVAVLPPKITVSKQKYGLLRSSDRLIVGLRRTGLFAEVDYEENLTNDPDLLVAADQHVFSDWRFEEGILVSLLTLGVIPSRGTADNGYGCVVRSVDADVSGALHFRHTQTQVFGWIGMLLNILPQWSGKYPEDEVIKRFTLYLLANQTEMESIAR